MSVESENPYLPSAVTTSPWQPSVGSVTRGIACAILAATIGYAIPLTLMLITLLVRFTDSSYPSMDRATDLRLLRAAGMEPGIACAVLFGLAAFLNYAPAQRLGLVRALMFVGGWLMVGMFLAMAIVSQFYGPFVRSLSDEEQTARMVLGSFIAFGVPLTYTVVHTAFRFRHLPEKQLIANNEASH